jgi:hypothetical protein
MPFATVLYKSIAKQDPCINLRVVIVDEETESHSQAPGKNLHFTSLQSVLQTETARNIYKKYAHTNADHLRWALKPVYILHLLEEFDKVIFIDPDMYFTGSPQFLFDELDKYDALLAPHWSEVNPLRYEDGLFSVMRNGLYSGGFVGATKKALPVLNWWAGVCHYKIEESKELGVFVDQKYLDLFPLLLENTGVIRHPGCNLTNINLLTCPRSLENGKLMISKKYEPIFIHFTRDTIFNIRNGNDPLLLPFLKQYFDELKNEGYAIDDLIPTNLYGTVKRKLLFRTRIKRFFYKLAEKL